MPRLTCAFLPSYLRSRCLVTVQSGTVSTSSEILMRVCASWSGPLLFALALHYFSVWLVSHKPLHEKRTLPDVLGPVVQSFVSLTSSLRVISLTVLTDSIYNILIFFAEKMWVAFALQKLLTFFSKKFQHICVSLGVNFNESLTNDIVSFKQLGPDCELRLAYALRLFKYIENFTTKAESFRIQTLVFFIFLLKT